MSTQPTLAAYEITEVWGKAPGKITVGITIITESAGPGEHQWEFYDPRTGTATGGYRGRFVAEASDSQRARWLAA